MKTQCFGSVLLAWFHSNGGRYVVSQGTTLLFSFCSIHAFTRKFKSEKPNGYLLPLGSLTGHSCLLDVLGTETEHYIFITYV